MSRHSQCHFALLDLAAHYCWTDAIKLLPHMLGSALVMSMDIAW